MEFIYPNFLWALLVILVPIIIHLFYFKRFKKVYFSNTRFLKEIKEETTNKNKLKNLLVLLTRIFAFAFLVFAFAQPYIPIGKKLKKGSIGVSIFIDNSFSMQSLSEDVPLIDQAKKTAEEIVNGFPDDVQFQILTNKLFGEEQKWIDKPNALERINQLKLSPEVKKIKDIATRQKQSFEYQAIDNKYVFWISDFQKSIFDIDSADIQSGIEYNFIMLQPVRERNVSIDSCYWESPVPVVNQTNKLLVKISNNSSEDIEDVPLNIQYNGQVYPSGKLDLKAMSSVIDTVDVRINSTGWNEAKLNIIDYPVVFDDDYFIVFNVPEKIKILDINSSTRANKYLNAAFDDNSIFLFNHNNINSVDYSALEKYQLVILEDVANISSGLKSTLKNILSQGTNVFLFPGISSDLSSMNDFLNSVNANIFTEFKNESNEASNLNRNEFVFKGVYDKSIENINPITVKGRYIVTNFQKKNSYHIIKFKNGESFIDRYKYGKGNFYLCTSPLSENYNDFAKNPDIFVPLIFKMSVSSRINDKLSYIIGKDRNINLDKIQSGDKELISIQGEEIDFIPKQLNMESKLKLEVSDQIKKSGFYKIVSNNRLLQKVAYNYNRIESKLEYIDKDNIENKFSGDVNFYKRSENKINFTDMINSKQKGIELWRWSIIFALLFLAFEILLLRFWKNK